MDDRARHKTCPWCFGAKICRSCQGQVRSIIVHGKTHPMVDSVKCPDCRGTGICAICGGAGEVPDRSRGWTRRYMNPLTGPAHVSPTDGGNA